MTIPSSLRSISQKALGKLGLRLQRIEAAPEDREFLRIHDRVRLFTMTSRERQRALYDAMQYLCDSGIEGDVVECGVWKGGSAMLAALALEERGDTGRRLYLYDTFTGMSAPTGKDVSIHGNAAGARWSSLEREGYNEWDYASLEEVRRNLGGTGYPEGNVTFVSGKVEDTIPGIAPERIALLRLDTDWYESTRHELEHLYPRLVPGGILILDDYGHWQGARQAVDEYLQTLPRPPFLARIDYTGRIAVKP
jgi:hypothetical protein